MVQQYFIDVGGNKDGPHDLLTIMRRIRSQRIGPSTLIFSDSSNESVRADHIPDIAMFFSHDNVKDNNSAIVPSVTLKGIVRDSLRFTFDNNIMTVYAGAMVLLAILLAAGLTEALGTVIGGMAALMVLVILHYIFFIFTLRVYRLQPFSADFINKHFAPVLPVLCFSGVVLALMYMGAFLLLVWPAIILASYYAFVPFFIYDRRMNTVEAMVASRLLVQKGAWGYKRIIGLLIMMHLGALILIFPIPLTLPMFAASLARIYEELAVS